MSSPQKDAVFAFLSMVIKGNIREAYDEYVHPDMIHHNVWHVGDRESLMNGMEENQKTHPSKEFEVKKILEEGDTVLTYSRLKMNDMPEMSVMHMFRFEDGKIMELWDMGQQIPENSPNNNGPF